MELLLLLGLLACPIVMSGMMVWMMLHTRHGATGGHRLREDGPE